jgi:CTD kinase subunit gamma
MLAKSRPNTLGQGVQPESSFYVDYVGRDLSKIVEFVVPEGRIGLPNLMSTKQVCATFISSFPPQLRRSDFGGLA